MNEDLKIPDINFLDNQNVIGMRNSNIYDIRTSTMHCSNFFIDLLEDKTEGIFVLLEDESKQRFPSVANFMNRTILACSKKPAFGITLGSRHDSFIIRHFAENTTYSSVKLTFSCFLN